MQTVDYENELNVLTVTAVHQEETGFVGTLYLLHNDTGQVLKQIQLPEPWKEVCFLKKSIQTSSISGTK